MRKMMFWSMEWDASTTKIDLVIMWLYSKKKVELVPKKLDGYYDRTYWDLKDHIDQVFRAHSQCPKLFELAICEIWAHLQMKNLTTLGLGFRAQLEHENPAWDACRFAQFFSTDSTPKPTFILTMQELTRTIIPFQGNEKKSSTPPGNLSPIMLLQTQQLTQPTSPSVCWLNSHFASPFPS